MTQRKGVNFPGLSLALLVAVGAVGCTNWFSSDKGRRVQTEPLGPSTSDRLRSDVPLGSPPPPAPDPARALEPVRTPEGPPPRESAAPSAVAPVQGTVEPDPRSVIDWLLKDRK